MRDLKDRISLLNKVILNDEIKSKSNGDSNFKIFDYDPEDRYRMEDYIKNFIYESNKDKIILIDLYKTMMEILKEMDYIDIVIEDEKNNGTSYSNRIVQDVLGIGTRYDDLIKNKILDIIGDLKDKIIIIYGLEGCYQIVRGHTILSILEPVITDNSLIMFYPGTYDGQGFKLFNKLENDNGYNASVIAGR